MCIFIRRHVINITIKDIAKIAGVSHSTVSRSLNDSPKVNAETKRRIREIAEEFDFEFNAGARSLSTRKTGTVGIIHPELNNDFSASLFCSALISETMSELDAAGIDFIPSYGSSKHNAVSNIRRLTRQNKVDAFIIIESMISADDYAFLKKHAIPLIQLHYRPKFCSARSINYIFSDNLTGGILATDHLIEHGCKKIMCITIKSDHPEILDRREGFFTAMDKHNLPVDKNLIFEADCTFHNGERIIEEQKEILPQVDGIFVHADIMALGVIKELYELGYKVPEDIRVIGYDDIELGTYFSPLLTTIHQPKEALSVRACSRLVEILKEETGPGDLLQEVITPYLVDRESC